MRDRGRRTRSLRLSLLHSEFGPAFDLGDSTPNKQITILRLLLLWSRIVKTGRTSVQGLQTIFWFIFFILSLWLCLSFCLSFWVFFLLSLFVSFIPRCLWDIFSLCRPGCPWSCCHSGCCQLELVGVHHHAQFQNTLIAVN